MNGGHLRKPEHRTGLEEVMGAVARIEQQQPVLGLELPENTSFDRWVEIGRRLCVGQQAVQWKIGDWWAFGDHRYGQRAKAAAEGIFGREFGTLMNAASVARSFSTSCRREALSWSHHVEVAPLAKTNPKAAEQLLDRAESEHWSKLDLRREVQALKAANDPGQVEDRQPAEPRPRSLSDAERETVEAYVAVIELSEALRKHRPLSEREQVHLNRARNHLADTFGDRRAIPDDFEVIFVEQGRLACEDWYRARRTTVDRWLILSGKQRLISERAAFVEHKRASKRQQERPEQVEQDHQESLQDRELAKLAAAYLRRPSVHGGVIISQGNGWLFGVNPCTSRELIEKAERKGFDIEQALADIQAEAV
jgi:hypothetical protein